MNKAGNDEIKYLIRITKKMIITLFLILVFVSTFVKKGKGTNGSNFPTMENAVRQMQLSLDTEYGKLPLAFIPNKGQVDKRVKFYARTSGYTLWLIKEGLVFDSINTPRPPRGHLRHKAQTSQLSTHQLPNSQTYKLSNSPTRSVSWLIFDNINQNPRILPLDVTCHKVNYIKRRNMSTWKLNISSVKAVLYRDIYRNIDLKVYGKTNQVEYDWLVKPGGYPTDITFTLRNVKSTRIDPEGNLVVETGFGELIHKKPVAFQVIEEEKQEVDAKFKKIGKNTYGFDVGEYDSRYELIIDPLVQLGYSTYLGGSGDEVCRDIAVDGRGR